MSGMAGRLRVAVTGTSGRVGRAMADHLGRDHEVIELPRAGWDFAAADTLSRIGALDFDLLVHPAAMTSLEACEDAPELAWRVNAEAPAALAQRCRRRGAGMIHFSTDYVLEGSRPGLRDESAAVGPLSEYGRSKLAAERAVLAEGGCVLRVSWVFGPERPAFPDQIVARALAGEPLAAVADKTSMPCFTADLAGWVAALIRQGVPGELLHACNRGEPASWRDVAGCVLDEMLARGALKERPPVVGQRLDEVAIFRVARPRHTAMASERLAARIGCELRPWPEAIRAHVGDLLARRLSR